MRWGRIDSGRILSGSGSSVWFWKLGLVLEARSGSGSSVWFWKLGLVLEARSGHRKRERVHVRMGTGTGTGTRQNGNGNGNGYTSEWERERERERVHVRMGTGTGISLGCLVFLRSESMGTGAWVQVLAWVQERTGPWVHEGTGTGMGTGACQTGYYAQGRYDSRFLKCPVKTFLETIPTKPANYSDSRKITVGVLSCLAILVLWWCEREQDHKQGCPGESGLARYSLLARSPGTIIHHG